MAKIVEKSLKVATKKYYDNGKTILPGNIYTKEVVKSNLNNITITRKYICSLDECLKLNIHKKLNKSQLELFIKINDL